MGGAGGAVTREGLVRVGERGRRGRPREVGVLGERTGGWAE